MSVSEIQAHRTALRRPDISRPLKLAIQDSVVTTTDFIFDFGCGHGDDLRFLAAAGYSCSGWDPQFRPSSKLQSADVVNLGYVINVISNLHERARTLKKAFDLARRVLIVSAQLDMYQNKSVSVRPFGDGFVTTRNTFQKLFTQQDLCDYIRATTGVQPVASAPGVFYVFKDGGRQESFLQRRYVRSPLPWVSRPTLSERYAEHKELLESFINCVCKLGRLPVDGEYERAGELLERIGSSRRALTLVQKLYPENPIRESQERRRRDMFVYLALGQFRPRIAFNLLPRPLQADIKIFFGTYTKAVSEGQALLFDAGNVDKIVSACGESPVGKKLPDDLYIHTDSRDELPPILRAYIGCAETLAGQIEDANIIKIHMRSGKVSYLEYPDFNKVGHPRLHKTTVVMLRERKIVFRDYASAENPPVLHRKETLLSKNDPRFGQFAALSDAEEKAGLLENPFEIGNLASWQARLQSRGYVVKGHKLTKLATTP